jgi:hypothetical protein
MMETLAELIEIIEKQNRLIEELQIKNSEQATFIEALLEC